MSKYSLQTVHLLPKDLRFSHGGAKLTSCPGRHLTSLRPCSHAKQIRDLDEFEYQVKAALPTGNHRTLPQRDEGKWQENAKSAFASDALN